MASFFPINAPLVNYFFYNYTLTDPGPNIPIAGGKIFFFDDANHLIPKPTYSDVSDANNPIPNTNPLVLNDAGATPLYYAETGLYYIVITGSDGDLDNPIWTFEHVNFEGAGASDNVVNYSANGQFLAHNDLPATDDFEAGEVRQAVTEIAYGGWTFERPGDSTAEDFVTFERFPGWSNNPSGNPRWKVRIQCNTPDSGDTYKDLRIKFANVNRFASAAQQYTFAFSGIDNLDNSAPVDLYLIKNFGTGGSATTETLLTTFALGAAQGNYYYSFAFGSNAGKTIGALDDDFVQLALRLRTDEELDIAFTDIQLQSGALINPVYPEITNQQVVAASIGGGFPVPNPDGSDLFLTPRLTANGWAYDDSEIGEIAQESNVSVYVDSLHPTSNKMLADGNQYLTTGYSPLGIPFSRLQAKYWDDNTGIPSYGTGKNYFVGVLVSSSNQLILANNSPGIATATSDGTATTGFTFSTIYTAINPASGYFCTSALPTPIEVYIINAEPGDVGSPAAGTAPVFPSVARFGNSNVTQISAIEITGPIGPGEYFTFQTSNGGVQNWYAWFQVDGVGADPAVGGRTGIQINLHAGDPDAVAAQKICAAINNWQATCILTVAASSLNGGDFFNATAIQPGGTQVPYYVWYKKDGVGTDPAVPGKDGIEVDIVTGDTAAQVAQKTQIAINMKYFAAPNYADLFFRMRGAGVNRFPVTFGGSENTGSYQFDDFASHAHSYDYPASVTSQAGGGATINILSNPGGQETGFSYDGTETRPINIYVTAAIRY